jgi:hypothetical protein
LMKAIPSFGLFNDRLAFDASKVGEVYEPADVVAWRSERNRWLVLSSLIDSALAADRSGQTSFRDYLLGKTKTLSLATKEWNLLSTRGRRTFLPQIKAKGCGNIFVN